MITLGPVPQGQQMFSRCGAETGNGTNLVFSVCRFPLLHTQVEDENE
jgi:hypothetical protein